MNDMPISHVPPDRSRARARLWSEGIRWTCVTMALLGWALSSMLLMKSGGMPVPLIDQMCQPASEGAPNPCDLVLNSRWSQRKIADNLSLPVAAFGAGYFALVGLWYLFVGVPRTRRLWLLPLLIIVMIGGYTSLDFVRIMVWELQAWCFYCAVVHIINGLLVLLSFATLLIPTTESHRDRSVHPTAALGCAALTAGLLAYALHFMFALAVVEANVAKQYIKQWQSVIADPEYVRWNHDRQPAAALPEIANEPERGNPDAPHTVVAFLDLQCPACRNAHDRLDKVLAKYPHLIRVRYRHFPQDETCNAEFTRAGHPEACSAARAVEAAGAVGGVDAYVGMIERCYRNQGALGTGAYVQWARELGLDAEAFERALDSDAVRERVANDVALGRTLGLRSMPVVLLDGKRVAGWSLSSTWDTLLGSAPATR